MNQKIHILMIGLLIILFYGVGIQGHQLVPRLLFIESDQNAARDSTPANLLQTLFDQHNALYYTKDSLMNIWQADSIQILRNKSEIKKYSKEVADLYLRCENLEKKFSTDTASNNNTIKYESDLNKYNSLIGQKYIRIDSLKQINIKIGKSQANHSKNMVANSTSIDILNKKIQPELFKIKNGNRYFIRGVEYLLFMADLDSHIIQTHLFAPKSKKNLYQIETVVQLLENQKTQPLMVTNAGMFTPTYEPEGLFIEDSGRTYYPLDTGGQISDANFYLKPNGVFYMDSINIPHIISTEEYLKIFQGKKVQNKCATQSGPMLVINGAIHPSFVYGSSNAKIRSGVGVLNNKKVLFAITLDNCNFYNFAAFFKDLANCKNALFLDGAISKMYVKNVNQNNVKGSFGPMISVTKK